MEIASTMDTVNVLQKFMELQKDLDDMLRQYQNHSDLYNRTAYEVQLKRQALEAFSEIIKMLEDQIRLQQKNQKDAQPHEEKT